VADLNSDGKPDVIAIDTLGQRLLVFLGNGDGTLRSPTVISTGGGDSSAVGDFNRDGKPDVAVGDYESRIILFLTAMAPEVFQPDSMWAR
jgi:hypothetical protein